MTLFPAVVQQSLRKAGIGYYIANGDFTIDSSTTFTAADFFGNAAGESSNTYREWGVWRPGAASSADYWRHVLSVNITTGQVTIDRAWADTTKGTEDIYLIRPGITHRNIIEAGQFGLNKTYFMNKEPLSTKPAGTVVSDAGFQSTATSSYTASNATFTKVSTDNSENVFDAIGSGRSVNSQAGGYISQRFSVTENEPVNVFALARLDSGTNAQLALRDVSNSADIGTVVEHDQEAWQWLVRRETIPDGCKLLDVRFQGAGASDDIYWGGQCVLFPNQSRVILDTKWDTNFKDMQLLYADLGGESVGNGVYQAFASQLKPVPPSDYRFSFQRTGANPGSLVFFRNTQRHWYNYPLFIWGRRSYGDLTALTLATFSSDASDIDLDLWDAALRLELFSMGDVARKVPDSGDLLSKANFDYQNVSSQSVEDVLPPAPVRVNSRWGRLPN